MSDVKIDDLVGELGASEDLLRRFCMAVGIQRWGLADFVSGDSAEKIRAAFAKLMVKPSADMGKRMELDIKIQVYASRDAAEENLGIREGSTVLRHPNKENELWMCARPSGVTNHDLCHAEFLYADGQWRKSEHHCVVFERGAVLGYYTLQYGIGTDYVVGSREE